MLLITFSLAFIFKPYSRLISGRVLITRVDTGNWETFAFLPDIKKDALLPFSAFRGDTKKNKNGRFTDPFPALFSLLDSK